MPKWSQSGFSLVQAMVLASALAGMALVGSKMSLNQKFSVRDAKTRDSIEEVHSMIYSILQNRLHCLATLAGTSGGTIVVPSSTRTVNDIVMNLATTNPFRRSSGSNVYTYMDGQVKIANMELTFPADLSTLASLKIDYVRNDGGTAAGTTKKTGFGTKNISKTILISLERSDPTNVKGCTSVTTDAVTADDNEGLQEDFCNEYELTTWDPTLRTCVVKQNICPSGEVFTGIDATGNKICRPFMDFIGYLIDPGVPASNTCPDDYDIINMTRERSAAPQNRVSFECNKTGQTCPSNYNDPWVGPDGSVCNANIQRGVLGQVVAMTDVSGTSTGTATYTCTSTGWQQSNPQCVAPCAARVGAGAQTWTVSSKTCSGDLPASPNNTLIVLNDTTDPGQGTASYRCVQGVWTAQGTPTCNYICPALNVNWVEDSDTCSYYIPQGNDGDLYNVVDSTLPMIGTARYRCTNGTWTLYTSPVHRCETQGSTPGGTCSWTSTTTWQYSTCSGFQTATGPGHSQAVGSKAACKALCNGCIGSKTFVNCMYTPNP